MNKYILSYDVGTTSVKTCLYKLCEKIELVESESYGIGLMVLGNGGAEQDPNEWWDAMKNATAIVLRDSGVDKKQIYGISFCAQMQGLVLVDKDCDPVRNAMSYMDSRAEDEMKKVFDTGIKIEGVNIAKLIKSIVITGVVASSSKDPVWKYNWVKNNEPNVFDKIYKWLDVKEFLIAKSCGEFVMTEDSAFATMLLDSRKGKRTFSKEMCRMLGVEYEHLPRIIKSTDVAGKINKAAAKQLGLNENTLVFGGGGDASLIGVGAGATKRGQTHIYIGTSGWVSTVIKEPKMDVFCKIAGIVGANSKTYNYFAELETAGKCIEWVKEHLAYEETIDRIEGNRINGDYEEITIDLYDYMMESIKDVPAGSNGVIFTPWLHGNRCPFEDVSARGMFFNIGIDTGKAELIHAVIEGVCYHLKWQIECCEKKTETADTIRFVGGGALAPTTCQILSNVLGKKIEVINSTQNVGAMGAAIISAVALGFISDIEDADRFVEIEHTYYPNAEYEQIYKREFEIFKSLYYNNKKSFNNLNS